MAKITVARLVIPEHVEDHMWERHRISGEQVRSLITRRHVIIRNQGRAPYRLIGRAQQSRCIAAPIVPTDDPLTGRTVSAWYCVMEEQHKLDRQANAPGAATMGIMHTDRAATTALPPHAPILRDDEVIEGTIVPDPQLVLEITLNGEESRAIEAAARAANVSMGRYIKQVALENARRPMG